MQAAAVQNETKANIQRLLTATTEEKADLAHSFELYKEQIRAICKNQTRKQIESEIEKENFESKKIKTKYENCKNHKSELT